MTLDPLAGLAEYDKQNLDSLLRDVSTGDAAVSQMLSELAASEGLYFGEQVQPKQEDEGKAAELVDRAAELQAKWKVQPGDLYAVGSHRLFCGDSTDPAQVARLMDGKRARMVFTDPPYGISFAGQLLSNTSVDGVQVNHHVGANAKHDEIENDDLTGDALQSFCDLFIGIIAQLNPSAWYICFSQLDLEKPLNAMRKAGLEWRSIIAWRKNQATLSGKDYKLRYEPIIYGQKGGCFYGERYYEEDVWDITRTLSNDFHPTMKPVELVVAAIGNSSKEGETVFDGFCGSGTTMIAAEQTNRICYGMEIEPKYCAVTLERLSALGLEPRLVS